MIETFAHQSPAADKRVAQDQCGIVPNETIAHSLLLELVRRGIQCMGGYNYLSARAAKLGSPLARQFRSCSEKTVWHGGAGWPDRPSRVCEKRSGTAVPLPASFASGKFIPTMLIFLRVQ